MTKSLPTPQGNRWQPLRSGLINLFKYENEVFQFESGKLLLRGNNGAGKSRVLALQLPFLLDGEISPHRVEPDGDFAKRMEWNLLMGDRHDNRLGYTWIEFGRIDDDGTACYITLACGLHARKHGKLNRWYLIAPLRIGSDLQLVSDQNIPLTKDRLANAIGDRGNLYEGPREYRAAVDETLFKLGARYEPLIELLIRLRQPQLSRKLEREVLSDALSAALPPLSPSLIGDVSAAFRGIEDDREAMNEYRMAKNQVGTFLKVYRTYAAVIVRRFCETVRKENSRYEQSARNKKKYTEEHDRLKAKHDELGVELEKTKTHLHSLRGAEKTLRNSPEMKSVETLEQARKHRDELQTHLKQAVNNEQHQREDVARSTKERDQAAERYAERRKTRDQAEKIFRDTGKRADLTLPGGLKRNEFEGIAKKRTEAVGRIRQLNSDLQRAEFRHNTAETHLKQTRGDLEIARETALAAETRLTQSVTDFTKQALEWEASTQELKLDHRIDWQDTTVEWLDQRTMPFPFGQAVQTAHAHHQRTLLEERESLNEKERQRIDNRQALETNLDSLRQGTQPEPPSPHTRAPQARIDRPGAPLWKLCEFHDKVTATERAGYEAAMESSGILDAWITPNGEAFDSRSGDVFLTLQPKAEDGGLNRVLAVTSDAIPKEIVRNILAQIGSERDSNPTWVTAEGFWKNGPLSGDWSKAEAEYLGFEAREKARMREIKRLEESIKSIDNELANLKHALSELETRLRALESDLANAPRVDGILEAAAARDSAQSAAHQAQAKVTEAEQTLNTAQTELTACRDKRNQDAADLGLSAWQEPDKLTELDHLMSILRENAIAYWSAEQSADDVRLISESAEDRLALSERRLEGFHQARTKSENRFAAADAELNMLQQTLGKTAEEVIARLQETLNSIEQSESLLDKQQENLANTHGELRAKETQIENAENERAERQQTRDAAVSRLHPLVANDFLREADQELQSGAAPWSVARAVEISRRAEQTLKDTNADDSALAKSQTVLQEQLTHLHDELGTHGYQTRAEYIQGEVLIIKCPFQGKDHTMSALHSLLGDEVAHRSQMLDEREREVIENHLIGEVAKELQERIRAGEEWVADVNAELQQRPTSSGIKLRFAWHVDREGAAGLAEANQQLLKMVAVWSPAERKAIGEFLQDRIRAERMENEEGSWQDHLTRALDYRTWRHFEIERYQDGKWQRLTRKTYGTGSGGEKAVTLTVPQFAAAAAHYRSAHPNAPRLILLDEVFVGIDSETRAELMGLLETFKLDYVMTSEREWGCYQTVPSLAIYQLASRPELNAVHVTRWVWNGKEKARDE